MKKIVIFRREGYNHDYIFAIEIMIRKKLQNLWFKNDQSLNALSRKPVKQDKICTRVNERNRNRTYKS